MITTKVVNKRNEAYDIDIGRPGKWGNPFYIGPDGTREEVIGKYRKWITGPGIYKLKDLEELRDKRLGCYCAPLPCHGDVLKELLENKDSIV